MKINLICLAFLISGNISFAQNSLDNTINPDKFIDVDLTKSISDYGFSRAALTKDLTPIDLGNFKSGNKNFLSSFNFDNQIAVLKKDGYIAIIFLEKQFNSEENTNKNIFYKSLVDKVRQKYGLSTNSNNKFTAWTSPEYELTVSKEENNSVLITYNNLIVSRPKRMPSKKSENKDDSYSSHRKVKDENAKILENYLNDFLEKFEAIEIRSFARINNDVLEIYFEQNQDLTPSYESRDIQEKIKEMESNSLRDTAKFITAEVFQNTEDFEVLKKTGLQKIKFILDIYYDDGTNSNLSNSININELVKLELPLRKREILDLLN